MISERNSVLKYLIKIVRAYVNHFKDPIYRKWYINYSDKLSKFRNIHYGEDCFIIGNGPSLNGMDLESLNNYYTFGLNKIFLLFKKCNLNIDYLVSVNRLVLEQSCKIFEDLGIQTFVSFKNGKHVIKKKKNIHFIYNGGPFSFGKDITERICDGATVTYVAMQIAYFMGFKNVFLIGVDHNFIANGSANEKQYLNGVDVNHFDPNYFGNQEWQLPNLEASELAYTLARYHYKANNRRIFDATFNGKLTVFPKISFQDALSICKKKDKSRSN